MPKSKITRVTGNGSWKGQHGTFYSFEYEFQDGTIGLKNHNTVNAKYKEGDEVEYVITGKDIKGNNNINFPTGLTLNSSKPISNTRSFALSYAKDLVIADKLSIDKILSTATKFNEWLNNK